MNNPWAEVKPCWPSTSTCHLCGMASDAVVHSDVRALSHHKFVDRPKQEQTISLETNDCSSISSFLRSAATYFNELAVVAERPPSNTRLIAQFKLQAKQAQKYADKFADSDFAHLILKDWS